MTGRPERIPSVICGPNATLIHTIAPLYLEGRRILDLTYGRGAWWKNVELDVTAFTGDYTSPVPFADETFDVVAYDPAYISTGGKQTTGLPDHLNRYGLDKAPMGVRRVFSDMVAGQHNAARIANVGGLILQKCQQQVESGRLHDVPTWLKDTAAELGLELVDEIIHHRGLGPQPLTNRDGSWRQWQRTQRAHSHLLVFRKTGSLPEIGAEP